MSGIWDLGEYLYLSIESKFTLVSRTSGIIIWCHFIFCLKGKLTQSLLGCNIFKICLWNMSSADSMNFHRCQYSVLFIFIKALWFFFFPLKIWIILFKNSINDAEMFCRGCFLPLLTRNNLWYLEEFLNWDGTLLNLLAISKTSAHRRQQ